MDKPDPEEMSEALALRAVRLQISRVMARSSSVV
jgi:hypothetical protein